MDPEDTVYQNHIRVVVGSAKEMGVFGKHIQRSFRDKKSAALRIPKVPVD